MLTIIADKPKAAHVISLLKSRDVTYFPLDKLQKYGLDEKC